MRVLFVSALPLERSSAVGRMFPLARATARAGHRVEILTLSGQSQPPYVSTTEQDGMTLRTVGPNLRPTEIIDPGVVSIFTRYWAGRRALTSALAETTADMVVLIKPQLQNTPPVLRWAAAHQVPLVVDIDDLEAESSRIPWLFREYVRSGERQALRSAAAVTACSPFLESLARQQNPRAQILMLPTGIPISPPKPGAALREQLHLPPTARIVLFAGSLSIASGHRVDLLLDAWETLVKDATLQDAHLVFSGDGFDGAMLKRRVSTSSLLAARTHFLGRFAPGEDIRYAQTADLLVDPVDITPRNEAKSSSRTMLALLTGTPIVTGDVGIRRHLIPPALHAFTLYAPTHSPALSEAMRRALTPGVKERFLSEVGSSRTRWSWETLGKTFVKLLEELAWNRRNSMAGARTAHGTKST